MSYISVFDGIRVLAEFDDVTKPNENIIEHDARAKRQNRRTKELLIAYHESFTSLYNSLQALRLKERENFEAQLEDCKNSRGGGFKGGLGLFKVEFQPENAEVRPEMANYIIMAMQMGKPLRELLPPDLQLCEL